MKDWHERYGGYLVAAALHILIASILIHERFSPPPPDEPIPIQMALTISLPTLTAQPSSALPTAGSFGDEAEVDEAPPPAEMQEPDAEDMEDVKADQEDPAPAPEEAKETQEPEQPSESELAELAKEKAVEEKVAEKRRLIESAKAQKRATLDAELEAEQIKMKGREHLDHIQGDVEGAVRIFELKGDPAIVQEIMHRYGLKVVTGFVAPNEVGGDAFLNQARTNDATYSQSRRSGLAEIFEIPRVAYQKLQVLEREEFERRKLDPGRNRIVEIVFGIVRTDEGWDLGVTNVEFDKLE